MDKSEAKTIQLEICAAADTILARHKLKQKGGSASYTEGSLRITINAEATDPAHDPKISDWKRYAAAFGLPANGLGRTFVSSGKTWKITGLDANRRRYPVVAACEGKEMLFTVESVTAKLTP